MDTLKRIENLLAQKNISVSKMMRDLGFSNSTFTTWKKRGTSPQGEALLKIANYLETSVDYLLGRDTSEHRSPTSGNHPVSDEDLKFALFGGDQDITDEMFAEVKDFAKYIKQREKNKQK